MPNYQGVWSLSTQYQYNTDWQADNVSPNRLFTAGIGLFFGGVSNNVTIDKINISSAGNATDFGDLITGTYGSGAVVSATRGVVGGATSGNQIQYVTFATAGNSLDFGDLSISRTLSNAASNATRGLFFGGDDNGPTYTRTDIIDYITIDTTGNATDFGNLSQAISSSSGAGFASTTRAVHGGGAFGGGTSRTDTIDYFTIDTTGNATDFGNLSTGKEGVNGCSSNTRGLFAGGYTAGNSVINVIEYITITNTGNTSDFGDLTQTTSNCNGSTSNKTTGVFNVTGNVINSVTIASAGNATDFGDLTVARSNRTSATGNAHGGLS
jgi:hypothetical protein